MAAVAHELSQPSAEWVSVPPEQAHSIWPVLEPMIARGLAHGQGDATTSSHMLSKVLDGSFLLWVALVDEEPVAGVILSVKVDDGGKKLWIEMLVGKESKSWADNLEQLVSDFRRLTGSRCIEASCRPGLARILKRRGWKQKAVIMELI